MSDLIISDIGEVSGASSVSAATLVRRVRDILGEDIKWRTLATAGDATDTGIAVTDGTDWNEGSILEWEEDGDQAYVQSVAGNGLTVIREVNGTTGAAHTATSATKDPIYPFIKVKEAIDATIQTLWPWAWKVGQGTITPAVARKWFDLDDSVIDLISVSQIGTETSPGEEMNFVGAKGTGKPVVFERRLPTTLVTSGVGMRFPRGYYNESGSIVVSFRALLTDDTSGFTYTDVPEGALSELVCWGAAARLMRSQSSVRIRNDSRQWNNSVTIEDVNQTSDFYYAEHRRLLMDYYDYLMRTAPPMNVWKR